MNPDASPLQAFRGETHLAPKLHSHETSLVIIASILLCFTPWAFGTMHVWSQFVSLGLAALALAVALIKRHYRGSLAPQGEFKLVMWPKLIRFPLFWIGLVLFTYILIQALNPAWVYVRDANFWWLDEVEHVTWLPSSITAPFKEMNAWRVLVIYGTAWMFACALWVGITRRSAVQALLTVVVINAAVLAIVGILQRVTHAKYILWVLNEIGTGGGRFFGTLIYKNHAGGYFNLVLMIAVGMLYWHFSRAERRMERTSPAPVFAFCAVLLGLSVILSESRAATMLMMLFTFLAFVAFGLRCTVYRSEGRSPVVIVLLCTVFALFIGLGGYFLKTDSVFGKVGKLVADGKADSSVVTRTLARRATLEMASDKLVTGWGAGSFRHYFPTYQRNYPDIYNYGPKQKMRWEYAHNDYVQLIAELGLIGSAIVLAMFGCAIGHLVRQHFWLKPHLVFLVLALFITAAHAWMDFQSHNPAILFLWCASAMLVGRWAELENRRNQAV